MHLANGHQISKSLTTDKAVNVTEFLVHLSHVKVFEIGSVLCEKHHLPFIVRASICRSAMIIEWNGNIEPELGEVYHIDVDIQVFGNSRGNVESDVFEKTIQAIISIFDPVELSINSLFDDGSSLLLGIVDINLSLSDR